MEAPDAHSALVSTRGGRAAIAVFVLVLAVWIVGPNLPGGPARSEIDRVWRFADDVGLAQDWGVFSPNAREQSLDVGAILTYDDGTVVVWEVPEFDPFIGATREYRWNKWQERVRLDARADLWDPTAAWIADRNRRDGELPQAVTLVRRWIEHQPLTADGAVDSDWNEFAFYEWRRDP